MLLLWYLLITNATLDPHAHTLQDSRHINSKYRGYFSFKVAIKTSSVISILHDAEHRLVLPVVLCRYAKTTVQVCVHACIHTHPLTPAFSSTPCDRSLVSSNDSVL